MTVAVENAALGLARYLQSVLAQHSSWTDFGQVTAGPTFRFPGVPTRSIALVDVTIDTADCVRMIESNTDNAAGASTLDADDTRADHEVDTLLARYGDSRPGEVLLRAYSPDTNAKAEILVRAALFAHKLSDCVSIPVVTRAAQDTPSRSAVNVVHGSITELADHLTVSRAGKVYWKNAPVRMIFNGNVLAELARRAALPTCDLLSNVDPGITHAGSAMTALGFSKTAQQDLCIGTGIVPVAYQTASDPNDAARVAHALAAEFGASIIKPDAASGGTMVLPVAKGTSIEQIRADLEPGVLKMVRKYGPAWADTCPINVYEFVNARPAVHLGHPYRWDLRNLVLASPESISVTPLFARLCPSPIDGDVSIANSVGNLTGRGSGVIAMLSPAELLDATFTTEAELRDAVTAIHRWMRRAVAFEPTG